MIEALNNELEVLQWCNDNSCTLIRVEGGGLWNAIFLWMALFQQKMLDQLGICTAEDLVEILRPYWKREIVLQKPLERYIKKIALAQLDRFANEQKDSGYLADKIAMQFAPAAFVQKFDISLFIWNPRTQKEPDGILMAQSFLQGKEHYDLLITLGHFNSFMNLLQVN